MFSQASDTRATPLGNWGERPGQAHDVITPAVTISALIVCSGVHSASLAADKASTDHGAGGVGLDPDPDLLHGVPSLAPSGRWLLTGFKLRK